MSEQGRIIDFSAIPDALRERAQWLVWKFEQRPKDKKPRKVPYYTNGARRTGAQGTEEDRARLVSFDAIQRAFDGGKWDGVGFAFLPGDGLIGIDLDGMIDPTTGEVSERCQGIVDACQSYTEFSPSGKGVHIIVEGVTETFKSNQVGVEVFCGRQFFTVTGHRYPGTPAAVRPIDAKVLRRLQATVDLAKKGAQQAAASAPAVIDGRAKVESALAYISPDLGYDDWIHIGMAIHAELGSAAIDVWDVWSAKSEKYAGRRDIETHWKSFKPGAVTGATLFKFAMDAGWQPPKQRKPKPEQSPKGGDAEPPPPLQKKKKLRTGREPAEWEDRLVYGRDGLLSCLANVYDILMNRPEWQGVVAFDEFSQRAMKLKAPPYPRGAVGEWESVDDTQTAMWLTRQYGFAPGSPLVAEAIEALARAHSYHPVRDWLRGLSWDGVSRTDEWLADCLGVGKTEYTWRVSRWFLLGMVARVMRPGVKFDYCLVLEGLQGKGKSSALSILGGEWFGDTDMDLSNKDSMSALRGKWLYEFAELGSLTKSESTKQKSFLSRQVDEFRPVYGRREIKCPRQTVFSGSTNEWEWNRDPTGGRRFWPVEVGELDLDALRAMREQLFAEAVVLFERGERFFPTAEEQREFFDPQQLRREKSESFVDALHDWVFSQYKEFSLATAAIEGLKLDAARLTRDVETRIGIALRKLGCGRKEVRNGMTRFWYTPPVRDTSRVGGEAGGRNDDPF